MGRKVKCRATGEMGDSTKFVKINGAYYKSQAVYDAMLRERRCKELAFKIIVYDFLGYKEGQPWPPYVSRKMKELSYYCWETILEAIQASQQAIQWAWQHKDFSSDSQRIAYIFAVVNNKLADADRIVQKRQEAALQPYTHDDTLAMMTDFFNADLPTPKQKVSNIESLLEG